jgi:hypothetical protein
MVCRCNLAEVEGDGMASLCVDLCEIRCLCEMYCGLCEFSLCESGFVNG